MQTINTLANNIIWLKERFPGCVTETVNADGKSQLSIDFDLLRQELSGEIVEGRDERYQFMWPDKKKAILLANSPINATLRPCREESVDFDKTQNIYIEGDNLDVLKCLKETYMGKVKMIYIDPPYNTGNDFVYNDDFAETQEDYFANSGQFDAQGNNLYSNTESNGRFHTDWLNMMYPRIKVARDLLTNDGVMFISIDDHELENLHKLCDEIFGRSCFVGNISWQRTYSKRNDSKGIPSEVEYILVYSKAEGWTPNRLPRTQEMNDKYKSIDGDPKEWSSVTINAPGAATHQGMVYAIQHPLTGELIYPPTGRCWSFGQAQMLACMNEWSDYELRSIDDYEQRCQICGVNKGVDKDTKAIMLRDGFELGKQKAEKRYIDGVNKITPWPLLYFTGNGKGGIRRKQYLENSAGRVVTNFWPYSEVGHTGDATNEVANLFGGTSPFDTPKPTKLLERIIQISTQPNDLIMDFFSGSATTAHAMFLLNSKNEDSNRKFILVQIPEETKKSTFRTISEIGKERIRRAGKTIMDASPLTTQKLDTGFRVFKLDSSNMIDVFYAPAHLKQEQVSLFSNNVKDGRSSEDLLFQVMLELGATLDSNIETMEIAGKEIFNVADGYLVACFDDEVSDEVVKAIAKMQPQYAVLRDSSLADDSTATNFEQIFKTFSPSTTCKIL